MGVFKFEEKWMVSIFDAILPADHLQDSSGKNADFYADFTEELTQTIPGTALIGLRFMAWHLTLCAPLFSGYFGRFHKLDRAKKEAVLAKTAKSKLYIFRELLFLYKTSASLAYGAMPEARKRMGYEPAEIETPSWLKERAS